MIEIKLTDADGTTISASKAGDKYAIIIGAKSVAFTFDEIEDFVRELAGAVALWNIIRVAELSKLPTPPVVS